MRNRILRILPVVIVLVILVFATIRYMPAIKNELGVKQEPVPVTVTEQDSLLHFNLKTPNVDKVKVRQGTPAESVRKVMLYLGDNVGYNVELPFDLDIITDNMYYIYAKDSSVTVSVMTVNESKSLSEQVNISNPITIDQTTIVDNVEKGPQRAAKSIANDKAVVVYTYDNPDAFATIVKGLENHSFVTFVTDGLDLTDEENTTILDELPLYIGYHLTVLDREDKFSRDIYTYESGVLTISKDIRKFDDAKKQYTDMLITIGKTNVPSKIYSSNNILYVELGDYTLGIYKLNYNSVLKLFGEGEEARYNIAEFLKGYNVNG